MAMSTRRRRASSPSRQIPSQTHHETSFSTTTPSSSSTFPSSALKREVYQRNTIRSRATPTSTTFKTKILILLFVAISLSIFVKLIVSFSSTNLSKIQRRVRPLSPSSSFLRPFFSNGIGGPIVVSSNATVVGLGGGYYSIETYRKFVGSLRSTGYNGNILLGLPSSVYHSGDTAAASNPAREEDGGEEEEKGTTAKKIKEDKSKEETEFGRIKDYLVYQGVQMFELSVTDCIYPHKDNPSNVDGSSNNINQDRRLCLHPYGNIPPSWSFYSLARDWLSQCSTCTGPVLLVTIPDVFFQQDPFLPPSGSTHDTSLSRSVVSSLSSSSSSRYHSPRRPRPITTGLHLYEEHPSLTTESWHVARTLRVCKSFVWDVPLITSGTVSGEYLSVLAFLDVVVDEMKVWMEDEGCRDIVCGGGNGAGGGIAVINYLYYDGRLGRRENNNDRIIRNVTVHRYREGLIYSFWGLDADASIASGRSSGDTTDGKKTGNTIPSGYDPITDKDGFFLGRDGLPSAVVRGIDRLATATTARTATPFMAWLSKLTKTSSPPVSSPQFKPEVAAKNENNKDHRNPTISDKDVVNLPAHVSVDGFTDGDTKILQDWVVQHGEDKLETYYYANIEEED